MSAAAPATITLAELIALGKAHARRTRTIHYLLRCDWDDLTEAEQERVRRWVEREDAR